MKRDFFREQFVTLSTNVLLDAAAEIERLRELLREWLDRPGIIENPTWRKAFDGRVRKALGE